jgi:hypothetical protein
MAMSRYMLGVFPIFLVLARILELSKVTQLFVCAMFAAFMGVFTIMFVNCWWVGSQL